ELATQLRLPSRGPQPSIIYRARGCERCQGVGYFGRVAVVEFLALTDAIRRLILSRATAQEIHRVGVEEGMRSMYEDGIQKAMQGITSIEEVLRVTRDV